MNRNNYWKQQTEFTRHYEYEKTLKRSQLLFVIVSFSFFGEVTQSCSRAVHGLGQAESKLIHTQPV